ncbi:hypothetical protein Q2T76_07840, partial [Lactobacillus sp. YT155]|nr:hypothetical protein [Lactobacillus sp. YT155]
MMDANTGREVTRAKITRGTRNDVQKSYPNIKNAAKSGFKNTFKITDNMRGKKVYVMSRYSSNS